MWLKKCQSHWYHYEHNSKFIDTDDRNFHKQHGRSAKAMAANFQNQNKKLYSTTKAGQTRQFKNILGLPGGKKIDKETNKFQVRDMSLKEKIEHSSIFFSPGEVIDNAWDFVLSFSWIPIFLMPILWPKFEDSSLEALHFCSISHPSKTEEVALRILSYQLYILQMDSSVDII